MTRLAAYAAEAIASLWRNRVRSMLTMLGMIIGSASIIAVFGISKAATSGIASTFASLGVNEVALFADPAQDYPERAQVQYRDVRQVAVALDGLASEVLPIWQPTLEVSFEDKKDFVTVTGDGAVHPDRMAMAQGRRISQEDVDEGSRVADITQDIAREFFGDRSALGNYIRIKGGRYLVVGVYGNLKGSFLSSLTQSTVVIPYTTFENSLAQGAPVDVLIVYPLDPHNTTAVGQAAIAALQRIHGDRARYRVQDVGEQLQIFENVLNIVGAGLSVIGAVALVVAGIGIMNIMLVSVTERTREIGIRKSIGASRNDIALQFLLEAVMLSLAGGLIGMAIGLLATVGAVSLLSKQIGEMIVPYLLIVSIALLFSLLVGTVFGTYPALRAATLDPIEALRS